MLIVIGSVAVTKKGEAVYSVDGEYPWKNKRDIDKRIHARRRALLRGGVAILGRKTFESMNSKPSSECLTIVVSTTMGHRSDILVEKNFRNAFFLAKSLAEGRTIAVLGGKSLWAEALPLASRVYITEVYTDVSGETLCFPPFLEIEKKLPKMRETGRKNTVGEKTPYSFVRYTRK